MRGGFIPTGSIQGFLIHDKKSYHQIKSNEIFILCTVDLTQHSIKISSNFNQWFSYYYGPKTMVWSLGCDPTQHRSENTILIKDITFISMILINKN